MYVYNTPEKGLLEHIFYKAYKYFSQHTLYWFSQEDEAILVIVLLCKRQYTNQAKTHL